jgi:hypothetical protein
MEETELSQQDLMAIHELLKRVQIQGTEAVMYVQLVQKLQALLSQKE